MKIILPILDKATQAEIHIATILIKLTNQKYNFLKSIEKNIKKLKNLSFEYYLKIGFQNIQQDYQK
jgi:hypothetical protein